MCARFELNVSTEPMLARFGLGPSPASCPDWTGLARLPLDEVRPTDRVPVIGPRRVPVALAWGLVAAWSNRPLINARAETLAETPTFQGLVGNRCLVPATAFFEWSDDPAGPATGGTARRIRRRHRIARADGALLAMAGLVDPATDRFVIITRPAHKQMAAVHPRMPVLLDPETEADWLDPARPFAAVRPVLAGWGGALSITPPPAPGPPPAKGA
ncbi:SOS response-associated peptidase [Roseospira visakhapatnamensis]|uniref:SOS response-associated peptidase n=1 Tax=Roseospira visakhapatnamensis TaxID=390880 RepID=UPI002484244A|nr:SOS response-associated peptidase family protein [Roseospira visakhapatnamensis]